MVVLGYNQEGTIGYAIDSVLNQDYCGDIVFVFSDDNSTDGTFGVMQKKAEAYRGRHKIILNHNEHNLKHAGNLLKALSLCEECEYQCKQDGDDYAAPDRVSKLVAALEANPTAYYAVSRVHIVYTQDFQGSPDWGSIVYEGEDSTRIVPYHDLDVPGLGCVAMWRKEAMEVAEEILSGWKGIGEDVLLMNMARLLGDVVLVEKELVGYVISSDNSSWINRRHRYSSLANFYKTEETLHRIMSGYLPWKKKTVQVLRDYMDKHPEMDAERRTKMDGRLALIAKSIASDERTIAYMERGFFGNVFHWLRHRDAPAKDLLPRWLKGMLGILVFRLKKGA